MNYGGKACTILNVLQKVAILLLTTYTILPEPPQKSGRTLIGYCILCKYVIVIYTYVLYTYLLLCVFVKKYTTMSEFMIFLWAYSA